MSAMDTIAAFLAQSCEYQKRLGGGGVGAAASLDVGDSWTKIGRALFKMEELKQLRDSLHVR